MTAEVCLLLVQSLQGDCPFTLPEPVPDGPPPLAAEHPRQMEASTPATASTIAPAHQTSHPQFGDEKLLCSGEQAERLMLCALPSRAKTQVQGQIPAPSPAAAIEAVPSPSIPPPSDLTAPATVAVPLAQRPVPIPAVPAPQFSRSVPSVAAPTSRPRSGAQLYRQRQLALQAGQIYTRLPVDQFAEQWRQATGNPSYEAWVSLLRQEARAVAGGQGQNRLEVVVGDSFGLWLPPEALPRDRLWLNQSISGDTTRGILGRLTAFADTRPTRIHLLAGANDLKTGVPEAQIVQNLSQALQHLQQQHPSAEIVIYSVFPTRRADIGNDRIRSLNAQIVRLAANQGVEYRDVHTFLEDAGGALRPDLTTDGLHLNERGYALWQRVLLATAG